MGTVEIKIDPKADVAPYIQLQSELEYFIVSPECWAPGHACHQCASWLGSLVWPQWFQ